jgi:hypothetical protein
MHFPNASKRDCDLGITTITKTMALGEKAFFPTPNVFIGFAMIMMVDGQGQRNKSITNPKASAAIRRRQVRQSVLVICYATTLKGEQWLRNAKNDLVSSREAKSEVLAALEISTSQTHKFI